MSLFDRIKEVGDAWEKHREVMLMSIEETHGTHNEDDVLAMILADRFKLWVFEKSLGLTEFQQYPRMKVLNLFMAGGDKDELFAHEIDFIAYARSQGCARFTTAGRMGWKRSHPDGWQFNCASMYKDIA